MRLILAASTIVTLTLPRVCAGADETLETQLGRECTSACQPIRQVAPDGGLMASVATAANPFLTSAECPEVCRSVGRRHPAMNMDRALLGLVLRCTMSPVPDRDQPVPVGACIAAIQLDETAAARWARRPPPPVEDAADVGSAIAVELEDTSSIGEWSWLFAFVILPSGPLLLLWLGLAIARQHERRRMAIVRPPAGTVLVSGRICDDGRRDEPAVRVSFELETRSYRGKISYHEKAHSIAVRPFTVETPDGQLHDVVPARDSIHLHAPVQGEGCSRWCAVGPGDTVWVYGRQVHGGTPSDAAVSASLYRTPRQGMHLDGSEAPMLVSTKPIEAVLRRDRNRRLKTAAALLGFLVVLELGFFGDFLDLLCSGRPATGHVTDKSWWWRTSSSRGSRPQSYKVYGVTVEAEGRTDSFEVHQAQWEAARKGSTVAVLVTPWTMALGTEPYGTIGKCVVALILLLFGLFPFILTIRHDSAWYSQNRGWRDADGI